MQYDQCDLNRSRIKSDVSKFSINQKIQSKSFNQKREHIDDRINRAISFKIFVVEKKYD